MYIIINLCINIFQEEKDEGIENIKELLPIIYYSLLPS